MRRVLLALALMTAGASAGYAETDTELAQKLVGTWGESSACDGDLLVFKADGTFTSGEDRAGTYAVKDGKLTGKVGDMDMPVVTLRAEGNMIVLVGEQGREDKLVPCTAN